MNRPRLTGLVAATHTSFAADGSPAPAALGFARSRGIDPSRLEVIKTEKGEYVGFTKVERGRPAADILPEVLVRVLSGLTFPKMMRWDENPVRFLRDGFDVAEGFRLFDLGDDGDFTAVGAYQPPHAPEIFRRSDEGDRDEVHSGSNRKRDALPIFRRQGRERK